MLRGHSSIEAALDLALLVERTAASNTIDIQATKARGADVKPFSAMFTFNDDNFGQLHKARFFANTDANLMSNTMAKKAILTCLGEETLNKTALVDKVREATKKELPFACINSTLEEMYSEGYLNVTPGQNNAQLYSRNPEKPYGGSTVLQA